MGGLLSSLRVPIGVDLKTIVSSLDGFDINIKVELLAKVRNLPFDRLRVNGLRFKLFSFSVRGELVEPQKNTFARASVINRF